MTMIVNTVGKSNFLTEMENFSFEKMDDYLEQNQTLMSDFYLNLTKQQCIKLLIYYQSIVILFSMWMAYLLSDDILIKFLSVGLLSFCLFVAGVFVILKLLLNKYAVFKDEAWTNLNNIKNNYIYNNITLVNSLVYSKKFYPNRFQRVIESISSKSLSNDDLYFIVHCMKNEKLYFKIDALKNYMTKK